MMKHNLDPDTMKHNHTYQNPDTQLNLDQEPDMLKHYYTNQAQWYLPRPRVTKTKSASVTVLMTCVAL